MTPDPTNPHLPAAPSPGALRLQQASVALSRRFLEVGSADELERTLAHAAHVVIEPTHLARACAADWIHVKKISTSPQNLALRAAQGERISA